VRTGDKEEEGEREGVDVDDTQVWKIGKICKM
jgi:hypothetical protein